MPAKSIALLPRPYCPFKRYRHGVDPPGQQTPFSLVPTAFDGKPFLLPWPSNNFCLAFISQQLNSIEPFPNPFRQTGTPSIQEMLYAQNNLAGKNPNAAQMMCTRLTLTISLMLQVCLLMAGAPDLSFAQEQISPVSTPELAQTSITFQMDQTLEFSDAEGAPVVVTPGTYRVIPTPSNQLQFISAETEEPTLVRAMTFHHAEPLSAPSTLFIQDEDAAGRLHLLLLFPGGQGWDAEGRREEIQARGIGDLNSSTFTPTQRYTAVILQQGRVTTDEDWNEQEAVLPSKNSAPYLNTPRSFGRVTLERGRLQLDEKARQSLFKRCRYCVKKP